MRKILITTMLLLLVFLGACNKKQSNIEKAEAFTINVLTVPYEEIATVENSNLHLENAELYEQELISAVDSLCGELAASEIMDNVNSTFFIDVITLHLLATHYGYSYIVDSVVITEVNDKQFGYDAKLIASNSDEPLTVIGSIQFDDNDLINYMSIKRIVGYNLQISNKT